MLDRGLGAAGVAIGSVAVHGVPAGPAPDLPGGLASRYAVVPLTFEQFTHLFTSACTTQESREAYQRYYIPAPGRIVWHGVLAGIGTDPATTVDFTKPDRAPLLFIAGGEDQLTPPALNRSNYQRYLRRSDAIVGYREFPDRSHFTLGQSGWQEVADCALLWAEQPTAD
jgi:alpha-beta hydrolase superfamily lysophospholipase